ncbi:MAG: hypothetical protein IJT44_11870 [Clostridia bacterium]|nr:hypothetical protein [Clostridia bacterium]
MGPILWLLPGALFGAAEFFLTKVIAGRVLSGRTPILLLCAKLASYAAVLVPVFLLLPSAAAKWFGIGAGSGVLAVGTVCAVLAILKEKR